MTEMSQLPLYIEKQIQDNIISDKDKLNRFKTLTIPLDKHLNNRAITDLIEYFLSNSNLTLTKQDHKSNADKQVSFDYKCISIQMGVSKAPLDRPSLK